MQDITKFYPANPCQTPQHIMTFMNYVLDNNNNKQ
jgi:hypothetical protein